MVNFPAVRSANFTDEVDIRDCSSYMVNVRSYTGQVRRITLQSFLKHIGQYITDLDPSEDWSDPIDGQKGKMQVRA